MKKTINTLLIAGFSVFAFSASAQKLAHINLDSLLKSMPETDTARKVEQTHYQQLESEVESMTKEYQAKVQDYQAHKNTYTPLIQTTKENEIQEMGQRIQAFQGSAQQDLQKFNDSISKPIFAKAKKAINEVAKEHKYTYVFDTSVLLYWEESDDISALVAEKLGLKASAKKSSK